MNQYGKKILALLLSAVLFLSTGIFTAFASETQTDPSIQQMLTGEYVEGQALVLYKSNPYQRAASPLAGLQIEQEWDFSEPVRQRSIAPGETEKIALVSKAGTPTGQLLTELSRNSAVSLVQPNYIYRLQSNDTFYDSQWSLFDSKGGINVSTAWQSGGIQDENVVAVVDTGVDYTHPDLRDKMWVNPGNIGLPGVHGYDFAAGDDDPMPDDVQYSYSNSHGTHCAGLIAAQTDNAEGIAGVSSNTRIMALKAADANGGFPFSACIGAYAYIYQAKLAGVNIVAANNSWGGGDIMPMFNYALDKVGRAGVLSILAAGNDSQNLDETMFTPANSTSPYAVTVAASTKDNTLAGFSCYGQTSVDVAAPGATMLSTVARDMYLPVFSEQAGLEKNKYYDTFTQTPVYENGVWKLGNITIVNPTLKALNDYTPRFYNGSFFLADNGYDGQALAFDISGAPNAQAILCFDMLVENPYYQSAVPKEKVYAGFLTTSQFIENEDARNAVTLSQVDRNGEPVENTVFIPTNSYRHAWNAPTTSLLINPDDAYIRLHVQIAVKEGAQTILFDCFGIGLTTGKYGLMSGTSMAAPVACGAAALLCSIYPQESPLAIRARLLGGTQPLEGQDAQKVASGGRIDLEKAISNPNPVPDFITLEGNTAVLSGHFMDGAALAVDGVSVIPQSAKAEEIIFDASSFADNAYHTITLSKNGRTFYLKQFFAKAPQRFQEEALMPRTNYEGALLSSANNLFYIGPYGEFFYRMTEDGWEELPACPLRATDNMQFIYTDGGIWAVSGFFYGSETDTTLTRYNIAENRWEEQTVLSFAWRSSEYTCCAPYNGKLYFYNAGLEEDELYRQFSVYDPASKTLQNTADFPVDAPYSHITMQQVADKLVAVIPEFLDHSDKLYLQPYIFDGTAWTKGKKTDLMSYETAQLLLNTACAASGDKLIYTGVPLDGYGNTVAYNPAANTWEGIAYKPVTTDSLISACVLDDRYYIVQPDSIGQNRLYSMPVASKLRTITVTAGPGGSVFGSGIFYNGDTVTLTVQTDGQNTFAGWKESGVLQSTQASYIFSATADRALTAVFNTSTVPTDPTMPCTPTQPDTPSTPAAAPPASTGTAGVLANKNGSTPFTGDTAPFAMLALLCILAAGAVVLLKHKAPLCK